MEDEVPPRRHHRHLLSEDDLVLGSNPFYSSSQRSNVLKIRVEDAHDQQLLKLFAPGIHHPPRSLWSLNSEPIGSESFIWAIFDQHDHTYAALQALGDPLLVQPALESDLPPSTVLRKVNINDWIMRRHPQAHSNRNPTQQSPFTPLYAPSFHRDFHPSMRSTHISHQFQNLDERSRYLHEHQKDAKSQKGEDDVMDHNDTSGIATPPNIMDTPIPASSRPSQAISKPSTTENNNQTQTPIPEIFSPTLFSPITNNNNNNHNNISSLGIRPRTAGNMNGLAGGGSQENGAAGPAVPDHRTTAASTTSDSAHAQRLLPLFSPSTLVDNDGRHDDSTPKSNLDVSTSRAPLQATEKTLQYSHRAITVSSFVNNDPADVCNNTRPLCGNLNFIGYPSGPTTTTIHYNSSITFPHLSSTDASISAQSLSSSSATTTSSLSSPSPSPISERQHEEASPYPRSAGDQKEFANKEEHPEDVSTLGFMLTPAPHSLTEHVNRLGGNVKVIEADFQTPAHLHQSYGLPLSLTMSSSSSSSSSQPSPHVAHVTPSKISASATAAPAISSNKLRISTSTSSATAHGTKITKTDAKFVPSAEGTSTLGPSSATSPPPPQPLSRSYSFPVPSQHSHVLDSDQVRQKGVHLQYPLSPTTTRETFANKGVIVPNDVPSVPVATFRQGDWFCPLPTCGAHNFGRNVACIICGAAKVSVGASSLSLSGFGPSSNNPHLILGKNNSSSGTTAATVGSGNVGAGSLSGLFVDPSLSLTSHNTNSNAPFDSGLDDDENNPSPTSNTASVNNGNGGSRAMAMGMGMGVVGTALNGPASQFGSSSSNAVTGMLSQRRTSAAATGTTLDMASETLTSPTTSSSSMHITSVIPRHAGVNGVGALTGAAVNGAFGNSSSLLNTESVHALGGIHQVAAIQEAIKAHQSQKDKSRVVEKGQQQQQQQQQYPSVSLMSNVSQRHNGTSFNGVFPPSAAIGGQLLIPTILGNSPPTPLTHGPLVINTNNGGNGSQSHHSLARRIVSGQHQQNGGRPAAVQSPIASSFAPSVMNSFGTSMMFSQMQVQQQYHQQVMPMHGLPSHAFLPQLSSSTLNSSSHASPPPPPPSNNNNSNHHQSSKAASLLTPSGRAFAVGGRVQNISRDELNPIFMFWPENEPFPAVNQIRPPTAVLLALGGVHGPPPPILNTGNKGPIDAQPGDWTCGKCDYLNWRRRRVCANCFPHAEGNTEGTKHSTSEVQERVALLASVLLQQQQQIQAQQLQQQQQQTRMQSFANVPDLLASSSRLNSARRDANGGIVPAFSGAAVGGGTGFNEMAGHGMQKVGHQKMDPLQILASKYGYAIPPPAAHGMHPPNPMQQQQQYQQQQQPLSHLNPQVSPNHPLNVGFNPNLPPRLAHGPSAYGDIGSGAYAGLTSSYVDPLKHDSLPFGSLQVRTANGGVHSGGNGGGDSLNGLGGRQTTGALQQHQGRGGSPTSSRSSVSLGHGSVESSSYSQNISLKIPGDEATPSPLPLLPAFLQEVVGDASETSSSRSSIHGSPSPPSSTSTSSSPFGNVRYPGGGSGNTKRDQSGRNVSASQFQQYSSLNRNASQSSIWSLGFDYGHAGDIDEHKFARV